MVVIIALGLGAGLGIGLWALIVGLFPPRPTLGAVLARVTTSPSPPPILPTGEEGWAARLGSPFVAPLRALGLPGARLRRDLAVLGRPVSTHLARQASCALAGLLAPVVAQLLLILVGLPLGVAPPVIAALVLAALAFLAPDLAVRAEARRLTGRVPPCPVGLPGPGRDHPGRRRRGRRRTARLGGHRPRLGLLPDPPRLGHRPADPHHAVGHVAATRRRT